MDSCEPHSAGQIFKNNKTHFHFLHRAYSKPFSRQEHWKWLQENLSVELIPRLVLLRPSEEKFTLSNDFRFLIFNCPGLDVLQLLRAHWHYYRQWIVTDNFRTAKVELRNPVDETPHSKIRAFLSLMTVQCYDGSFTRLYQTYLPRSTILQGLDISDEESRRNTIKPKCGSAPSGEGETTDQLANAEQIDSNLLSKQACLETFHSVFPLLAVPDPEEDDWDFLENLGVMIKVKAKDLIARLQQLQGTDASRQRISGLYERIQASANEDDMSLIE